MIPRITSIASIIFCIMLGALLFINFQESLSIFLSLIMAAVGSSVIWLVFFDRGLMFMRLFCKTRSSAADRND